MGTLFDDISRIVASQISRRQALRLIGISLAGAALAPLGLERVQAAPPLCLANARCGRPGDPGCPEGENCCLLAGSPCLNFCVTRGRKGCCERGGIGGGLCFVMSSEGFCDECRRSTFVPAPAICNAAGKCCPTVSVCPPKNPRGTCCPEFNGQPGVCATCPGGSTKCCPQKKPTCVPGVLFGFNCC